MTAELAIAAPILFLILLTIMQFALWSHATHIAQTAAAQGLSAVRVHTGTAADGESRARQVLTDLGSGPLTQPEVRAQRGAEYAAVTVTGIATPVVPFLRLHVHGEASGAVERFIPDLASG